MESKLIDINPVGNTLGEGVTWDDRTGMLWWTDIQENKLYRLQWSDQSMMVFDLPERLCSFGFTSDKNRLVAAFADGFYLFCPETGGRDFACSADAAVPDGAVIDSDGFYWSAQWGNGQVVRYTPDGHVDRVIQTPAPQVTCVDFGGPDLDLLFVTTAREGLSGQQLEEFPLSGHMFVYETGCSGIALDSYYSVD